MVRVRCPDAISPHPNSFPTGEIYKVKILSNESYIVNSVDLAEELCDERRFGKKIDEVLQEARHAAGDGLFTAHSHEPAWAAAHRTLMPAFGPIAINEMYDEMSDIASQLVSKWARNGPEYAINVSEDMTRLTLDSIALCAMDMRFNSFYKEEMHPVSLASTERDQFRSTAS
jgi:cytochrome P450/NADPH-cytochrome P450 reductase